MSNCFIFWLKPWKAITAENCSVYQTTGLTPTSLFNFKASCQQGPKESIEEVDKGECYHVKNTSERGVAYVVDMLVGVCTCPQGLDGSPCKHQAAIAIHSGTPSINCIQTLAPQIRRIYTQIALGKEAVTSFSFYVGIHDHIEDIIKNEQNDRCMHPDFSSPTWDLI